MLISCSIYLLNCTLLNIKKFKLTSNKILVIFVQVYICLLVDVALNDHDTILKFVYIVILKIRSDRSIAEQ